MKLNFWGSKQNGLSLYIAFICYIETKMNEGGIEGDGDIRERLFVYNFGNRSPSTVGNCHPKPY